MPPMIFIFGGGVTPRGYEYQIILNCLQYLQILNAMI
jgi:hypothetical protein